MNNYQIIKSLGSGAAGKVFLAKHKISNEQFAIKEIDVESKDVLNHTLKEIENMKRLNHPYIVHYHDSFQENGKLYILMEYIDGGDLASFIADRKNRFLTEEVILKIFVQMAVALRYIHEKKIVHRDLKPQNIFMTRVGVVKIGDFGVSRFLDKTGELLETKVGTPYYLSPEIWNNEPYNSQTDIWSLGCILYELCTLKKPFKASNINQLIVAIFNGGYEPLTTRYTEDLRNLVGSMLEQDPKNRPSAAQIITIPFITSRMQSMVLENEAQLQSVNIITPAPRVKSAKAVIQRKKVKSSPKKTSANTNSKKKKRSSPQIIDANTDLPLPDSDLPRWALRASRRQRARTQDFEIDENGSPRHHHHHQDSNSDNNNNNNQRMTTITTGEEEEEEDCNEWDELRTSTKVLLSLSLSIKSHAEVLPDDPDAAREEAAEIEKRLRTKLGDELFEQLLNNLQNEFNPTAKQYVDIMEDEYPTEVGEIRRFLLFQKIVLSDSD